MMKTTLLPLVFMLVSSSALADPEVTYDSGDGYAKPPPPRHVLPPPPPPPIVVRERDPYDTPGIVIVGVGFGGMILRSDLGSEVVPAPLLHLGLAVGAAEFALRTSLAPRALDLDDGRALSLYATRATFSYRFLPGATVHPVAGIGLESVIGAPSSGSVGHTFAATARVGLELAFPLHDGALALGLDTEGHLPFAATDSFPVDLSLMLGFGAYVDYRF